MTEEHLERRLRELEGKVIRMEEQYVYLKAWTVKADAHNNKMFWLLIGLVAKTAWDVVVKGGVLPT